MEGSHEAVTQETQNELLGVKSKVMTLIFIK